MTKTLCGVYYKGFFLELDMWFKNIHYYQCLETIPYDAEALVDALEDMVFEPCAKMLPLSLGWVPPMPNMNTAPLVHAANGILMFCLQIEEKVIPASVVREETQQRVKDIQEQQHRIVAKRERLALKEDVYHQLVTQAFSKYSRIYAYFDTQTQCLVIDTSSTKRAEQVTEILRKSLGHCKLAVADTEHLSSLMTAWLQQSIPENFTVSSACVLQNTSDEKSLVRCQRQDLFSPHVQGFLKEGSQVIQLALSWQDQIEFVLKHDFTVSQIRFLESLQDLANHGDHETPEQRFDTDVVLMTESLRLFLKDLLKLTEFKAKAAAPVKTTTPDTVLLV